MFNIYAIWTLYSWVTILKTHRNIDIYDRHYIKFYTFTFKKYILKYKNIFLNIKIYSLNNFKESLYYDMFIVFYQPITFLY